MRVEHCVQGVAISWLLIFSNITLAADQSVPQSQSHRAQLQASAANLRTWTDPSGKQTAQATLLDVQGDAVRLRKSNGKLAVIKIEELSRSDQQYIARQKSPSQPNSSVAEARTKAAQASPSGSWLDRFKLPDLGAQAKAAETSSAYLIYARVSRDLLEQYAGGTVDSETPVTDNILGTSFFGTAHTRGKTKLVLQPNEKQAVAELVFSADIDSQTTGYNGPIVTHNVAQTQVQTRKIIAFGNAGVRLLPATSSAYTSSQTLSLEACLSGLRGRIAQRIAWKTADATRPQIDEIVSQRTANSIERTLDSQMSPLATAIQAALQNGVRQLPYDKDKVAPRLRFRSMPEFVDVTMYRSEGTPEERKMAPPAIEGRPQIALRVHRSVVGRALTDPNIREVLQPLFDSMLQNSTEQKTASSMKVAQPIVQLRWSPDSDWLMLDYQGEGQPAPQVRTAQQAAPPRTAVRLSPRN